MSVTAQPGSRRAGSPAGIKPSGAPDLAIVATADHAAGRRARACSPPTSSRAAPVQISRVHLARRQRGGGRAQLGQRERGHRGGRAARRAAAWPSSPPRRSGCAPRDVLVCSTGLIGIPMPMDPVEAGIPKLAAALTADADGGARPPTRSSPPTPCARRRSSRSSVARRRSRDDRRHGQGRGDALARDGHDARGAHDRRRGRPEPAAHDAARRGRRLVQQPHRRRLHQHQRHRAGARQRRARQRRRSRASSRAYDAFGDGLADACADLARQMAADAEGATKLATVVVRGRTLRRPRRAPRRGRWRAASSCSARCTARTRTGVACSRSSVPAARGSIPERVDIAYQGVARVSRRHRRAARRRRARAVDARSATSTIDCDLHAGTGEATVHFTDLTHAYVDENMGTS